MTAIPLLIVIALLLAGLLSLGILGEAWLLQRLFNMELWQLALIVLGSLGVVAYVFGQIIAQERSAFPFMLPPMLDEFDEEAEVTVPPTRSSKTGSKSTSDARRKR